MDFPWKSGAGRRDTLRDFTPTEHRIIWKFRGPDPPFPSLLLLIILNPWTFQNAISNSPYLQDFPAGPMNKFQIVTLFPDYFTSPLKEGVLGRAFKEGLMEVSFSNPRQFTKDGRVDDYPFGGGDSMILSYHPLKKSLESFSRRGL